MSASCLVKFMEPILYGFEVWRALLGESSWEPDAHRSRWGAGAGRRCFGVHGEAGKELSLDERNAAWLRVQHSRDLHLARPWRAAQFLSVQISSQRVASAVRAALRGRHACSAAQLLAATSAQPPPCAHCRAHEPPFSLHFKPPFFAFQKGPSTLNPFWNNPEQ